MRLARLVLFVVVLAVCPFSSGFATDLSLTVARATFFSGQPTVNPFASYQAYFDDPAELPRVHVNSAITDTPAPGKVRMVKAGGELQQTLDEASCGDTIKLEEGVSFQGRFKLPAKPVTMPTG
jgi:hypothetical protein